MSAFACGLMAAETLRALIEQRWGWALYDGVLLVVNAYFWWADK